MEVKMENCPKCMSNNVVVRTGAGVGWGVNLMIGLGAGMHSTFDGWETYLCTDCGYFENYVTKQDWLTRIKTDPKKEGWRKQGA